MKAFDKLPHQDAVIYSQKISKNWWAFAETAETGRLRVYSQTMKVEKPLGELIPP